MTRGGSGKFACESADGKHLIYQPTDADSPLLAMPVSGGPARQLSGSIRWSAGSALESGIELA